MAILTIILNFLSGIFAEVIKDVLSTPAQEISVEEGSGQLDLPSTPADDLRNQFKWMLDRG